MRWVEGKQIGGHPGGCFICFYCFRGSPTQINIDRQWNNVELCKTYHGRPQTGSRISILRILHKNAISDSKTMFSMVPDTRLNIDRHRNLIESIRNTILTNHKPEIEITLLELWIEMRFQILKPCFNGPTRWCIDILTNEKLNYWIREYKWK